MSLLYRLWSRRSHRRPRWATVAAAARLVVATAATAATAAEPPGSGLPITPCRPTCRPSPQRETRTRGRCSRNASDSACRTVDRAGQQRLSWLQHQAKQLSVRPSHPISNLLPAFTWHREGRWMSWMYLHCRRLSRRLHRRCTSTTAAAAAFPTVATAKTRRAE